MAVSNIKKPVWTWVNGLKRRTGGIALVVMHHAAASSLSPSALAASHRRRGWTGPGYTIYHRKNGDRIQMRPWWAWGAHALGYNDQPGFCFEGNFEKEKMGDRQLDAGRASVALARKKYGKNISFVEHGELPGNATACAGKNFPLAKMLAEPVPPAIPGKFVKVPVPATRPVWWGPMMRWVKANRG